MAYDFFLGKIRLPVPPSSLQVKINSNNKTLNLINEGEINILKAAGLTDITFTALFPNVKYPFAHYDGGYKNASFFLTELERLKKQTDEKGKYLPFQFIVSRVLPNGTPLFKTDITVTLEDYKITDDAENGFDTVVDIVLRQYRSYGTKIVEIVKPAPAQAPEAQPKIMATFDSTRFILNPPTQQSYTVEKGDCLWNIAQKMLGDGSRYPELYALNKDLIDGRNSSTGNTKYTIYPGQKFIIP